MNASGSMLLTVAVEALGEVEGVSIRNEAVPPQGSANFAAAGGRLL
jgi:hypothetical protein